MSILRLVQSVLGFAAAAFVIGFGIQSSVGMPDHAAVYLIDATKTYIALPCAEEWRTRPGANYAFARLGTAGEAQRLHYGLDYNCIEAGGYIDDDRSLSALLLVKLGILSPMQHWWDRPYRTEDGVFHPHP